VSEVALTGPVGGLLIAFAPNFGAPALRLSASRKLLRRAGLAAKHTADPIVCRSAVAPWPVRSVAQAPYDRKHQPYEQKNRDEVGVGCVQVAKH
jgi:hypothetical protein